MESTIPNTPENDMPPRYNAPLIAEWAGVQTLSRTRTKESPEYNGPESHLWN